MTAPSGDAPAPPPASDGTVGPRGHAYAVTIRVDGADIPLKAFLHDLIGGAVTGLLEGLRDVPDDPKRVEIEVRRP